MTDWLPGSPTASTYLLKRPKQTDERLSHLVPQRYPPPPDVANATSCTIVCPARKILMVVMPVVTRHLIDRGDGATVELFQAQAASETPAGAILFVHGNQGGRLLGGIEAVDSGALLRFCSGLNITAAAVSQPGFGASDGPPDFCGPKTQEAIIAALAFLRGQPSVDPNRIVLYGNSRGAVASAMVATQVSDLRAVILSSGVYDLEVAYHESSDGLRGLSRKRRAYRKQPFWLALHCIMRPKFGLRRCCCMESMTTVLLLPKPNSSQ